MAKVDQAAVDGAIQSLFSSSEAPDVSLSEFLACVKKADAQGIKNIIKKRPDLIDAEIKPGYSALRILKELQEKPRVETFFGLFETELHQRFRHPKSSEISACIDVLEQAQNCYCVSNPCLT